MTDEAAERRALRPLWLLTTGAVLAASATALVPFSVPGEIAAVLVVCGVASFIVALCRGPGAAGFIWFAAGLALVAGRGFEHSSNRHFLDHKVISADASVRVTAVVLESWINERWGRRNKVGVISTTFRDKPIELGGRCALEIRGASSDEKMPQPGAKIELLARVRGSPSRPLLVSSPRLMKIKPGRHVLPAARDRIAGSLLHSAGTRLDRIRAAETAAALALGRRDLVPRERRDRWRRSGLAHVLAVSGLHVGLVGGAVWLLVAWSGASPRTTRLILIALLPSYALLAGAAPSAMRAALMGVIYLGARLLGRAIIPMAAVLLTALCLLVARPELVLDPGFQLTIVITAALVRWVPPLTRAVPIPRWLAGALTVPIVAQTAAAPIVAWHFRSLIPGAILANVAVLPLLAPTVLFSVAAAVLAPIWSGAAGWCLQIVFWLTSVINVLSSPARSFELVTPQLPLVALVVMAAAGWLSIQPGRRAKHGAVMWIAVLLMTSLFLARPPGATKAVEALPVGDGAAVLLRNNRDTVLVDGGRFRRQAAEFLADARTRKIDVVIASHSDEDHTGGLVRILRTMAVKRLLIPLWMMSEVEIVPLLRAARSRGVRVSPVARGVTTNEGTIRLDILWPPPLNPPKNENERSIVVRASIGEEVVLLTADIGRETEFRLARLSCLDCDVLVVAHHGSRGSTSRLLLNRATPSIAVIPAGSANSHDHPHDEVLQRLDARSIPTRWPARDGWCGAAWDGSELTPFP